MTENNSRHLIDRLAEIEDPRNEKAGFTNNGGKGNHRVCKVFGINPQIHCRRELRFPTSREVC